MSVLERFSFPVESDPIGLMMALSEGIPPAALGPASSGEPVTGNIEAAASDFCPQIIEKICQISRNIVEKIGFDLVRGRDATVSIRNAVKAGEADINHAIVLPADGEGRDLVEVFARIDDVRVINPHS